MSQNSFTYILLLHTNLKRQISRDICKYGDWDICKKKKKKLESQGPFHMTFIKWQYQKSFKTM